MKNRNLGRRDFLKLGALFSAGMLGRYVLPRLRGRPTRRSTNDAPGIIVILLDTLTARDMSLYGYPRRTTPNFERIAEHCNVYHSHYSTASFTSPGTSSLLTGLYPWVHRAFDFEGLVTRSRINQNIFNLLGDDFFRLAYGQNPWADLLLDQFASGLDSHIPLDSFNLNPSEPIYRKLFGRDAVASRKSIDSFFYESNNDPSGSSVLGSVRKIDAALRREIADRKYSAEYPMGVPNVYQEGPFLFEQLFDGVMGLVGGLPASAFAYIHLFPPHYPLLPKSQYIHAFDEGWQPAEKPSNFFMPVVTDAKQQTTQASRRLYDANIASVDDEMGRLHDYMTANGIYENNYVIITSDHGDIYERGLVGHTNPLLYEPLIHIPLLISSPGQANRVDIKTTTCSIDVLPTVLKLAGKNIQIDSEGRLLPGFGGEADPNRSIFAIDCKSSPAFGPIQTATLVMRKGDYKLIGYFNEANAGFELFDMKNDPEELQNIFATQIDFAASLRAEMESKRHEMNAPYLRGG